MALVLVLATLFVVALIGMALLRSAVRQHRQVQREADRMQAFWLAEAGVMRAADALGRSPDYSGETWKVITDPLDRPRDGLVVIGVRTLADDPRQRLIEVQARYPAAGDTGVVQIRTTRLTLSVPGDG